MKFKYHIDISEIFYDLQSDITIYNTIAHIQTEN